jgi:hypothetical protein
MDNSGSGNGIERFGLGSILTTFGIKSAEAADIVELSDSWVISTWGMPEWALMVSMIGGVMFIINQILARKIAQEILKKLRRENENNKNK